MYYVTLFFLASASVAEMLQPQFNSLMGELMSIFKVFAVFIKFINVFLEVWVTILLVPAAAITPDLIYFYWSRKIKLNPKDMVLNLQQG